VPRWYLRGRGVDAQIVRTARFSSAAGDDEILPSLQQGSWAGVLRRKTWISDGGCCDGNRAETEDQDFADQMTNKSCTILVEVTNACNLAVRFTATQGDRKCRSHFQGYMLG